MCRILAIQKSTWFRISGNSASGEFAHTLNVTDIHTTWTESRAVLGRGEEAVQRALNEIAVELPFRLLGVDSDNVLTARVLGKWSGQRSPVRLIADAIEV